MLEQEPQQGPLIQPQQEQEQEQIPCIAQQEQEQEQISCALGVAISLTLTQRTSQCFAQGGQSHGCKGAQAGGR